jgi:hypothetical protein
MTAPAKEAAMTTPLFTLFARLNPFTKPHWRWTRACWMAKHYPRASPRLDDADTRYTFWFLRCMGRCQSKRERAEVDEEFADRVAARQIHRNNGNVRLELECRLLARQTDEQIAKIMSLPVLVVSMYERIFFDVRPRLHASDWIVKSAIGNRFVTETGQPNIGTIARQFSYFGGPVVLAMVLPRLLDGRALSDAPLDLENQEDRRTMRVRLLVQSMTMPKDWKTARELLKLWPHFMPYLSLLPEAPTWDGVLMDRVPALPKSVLHTVGMRASRTARADGTVQRAGQVEELPMLLLLDAKGGMGERDDMTHREIRRATALTA